MQTEIARDPARSADIVTINNLPLGQFTVVNEALEKTSPRFHHTLLGWCQVHIGFWRVVSMGRRNTFDIVLKTQYAVPQGKLLPDDQIEATCFSLRTSQSDMIFTQPISLSRIDARFDDDSFANVFVGLGEVRCAGQNRLFPNDMIIDLRAGSAWGLRTPVLEL